jgi:hypothetical protein
LCVLIGEDGSHDNRCLDLQAARPRRRAPRVGDAAAIAAAVRSWAQAGADTVVLHDARGDDLDPAAYVRLTAEQVIPLVG